VYDLQCYSLLEVFTFGCTRPAWFTANTPRLVGGMLSATPKIQNVATISSKYTRNSKSRGQDWLCSRLTPNLPRTTAGIYIISIWIGWIARSVIWNAFIQKHDPCGFANLVTQTEHQKARVSKKNKEHIFNDRTTVSLYPCDFCEFWRLSTYLIPLCSPTHDPFKCHIFDTCLYILAIFVSFEGFPPT